MPSRFRPGRRFGAVLLALAVLLGAGCAALVTQERELTFRPVRETSGWFQGLPQDVREFYLPVSDAPGAERLFTAIDVDKDGNVTPGEMRAWHKQQREDRKAERQKARAENETAKAEDAKPEDARKDGKRHHGERHHDGKGRHGAKWGPGGMMFRIADKDENGQVSKQEALDTAEAMFKRLDKNNDGVISIDDMPDR